METFKKILRKLLFPHIAIVIILSIVSVALLPVAFIVFGTEHIFSYVAYTLSAYTLTVVCFRIPNIIKYYKRIKNENKYVLMYKNDVRLRTKISLGMSLLTNSAHAVFQLCLGIYHGSFWFYSLAIYYFLLVLMRGLLLRDVRGNEPGKDLISELKRLRFCGIVLIFMNLSLVLIVFFMTYFGRSVSHHYITTIALAALTFTSMTMAIINTVKYRKYNSPVLSATKVISLASASVSMLMLETSMLQAFGGETDPEINDALLLSTGIALCLFILLLAILMIIRAQKELRAQKKGSFR